jgi:hypothetical protein
MNLRTTTLAAIASAHSYVVAVVVSVIHAPRGA